MSEITKEELRERIGNIELIRDIILGSKSQEYDNRLDQLESKLSLLEQETRALAEQIKADCLTELRASVDSLDEKIKSLSFTTQKDNVDLRQLLDNLYKNFASSLESIDKTLINQTTSIRRELSETKDKLQDDTRSLKSQILDELEKRFSQLKNTKMSRNDIADILFELGLRIKKTELAPDLKEAVHPNGSEEVLLLEGKKFSE